MIICFDLDDTLYDEISYVESGFKEISKYLNGLNILNFSENEIYLNLMNIMERKGRGRVFDEFLKKNNIKSKNLVKRCLSIYRKHKPNIKLNENVKEILCLLKKKYGNLYLVTDGNLIAQRNKIKALNLNKYFYKTLPTHQYGTKHSKPSTYVFEKICKWEKIEMHNLVYIGDNPYKDFVNLKKLGAITIRLNQGMFKNVNLSKKFMADFQVDNIKQINKFIIENE